MGPGGSTARSTGAPRFNEAAAVRPQMAVEAEGWRGFRYRLQ